MPHVGVHAYARYAVTASVCRSNAENSRSKDEYLIITK